MGLDCWSIGNTCGTREWCAISDRQHGEEYPTSADDSVTDVRFPTGFNSMCETCRILATGFRAGIDRGKLVEHCRAYAGVPIFIGNSNLFTIH